MLLFLRKTGTGIPCSRCQLPITPEVRQFSVVLRRNSYLHYHPRCFIDRLQTWSEHGYGPGSRRLHLSDEKQTRYKFIRDKIRYLRYRINKYTNNPSPRRDANLPELKRKYQEASLELEELRAWADEVQDSR